VINFLFSYPGLGPKTSSTLPLCIEVPVLSQVSEWSCICVLEVPKSPLSTIFFRFLNCFKGKTKYDTLSEQFKGKTKYDTLSEQFKGKTKYDTLSEQFKGKTKYDTLSEQFKGKTKYDKS
jgi:hypothetical protein